MTNGKSEIRPSGRWESLLATFFCEHRFISNDERTRFAKKVPETCPHCGADHSDCKGIDGPERWHGMCHFFGVDTGIRYEEITCHLCRRLIGKRIYYRFQLNPIRG
jgi:hypothetical protein